MIEKVATGAAGEVSQFFWVVCEGINVPYHTSCRVKRFVS